MDETPCNPVAEAYRILVNAADDPDATLSDLQIAIEEALGHLGEALD